jgi:hypothetical protein
MNCNVLSRGYVSLRMAHRILAIVFLLTHSMASMATETCVMSDITLRSQWDVDNFQSKYGGAGGACEEVSNNLIIANVSNLTNLNGLANLRRIGGNLEIHNNDSGSASNPSNSLTDISGLRNIERVGNGFEIISNSMLSDCRPVARLIGYPYEEANVGSYIIVAGNADGCNSVDEIFSSSGPQVGTGDGSASTGTDIFGDGDPASTTVTGTSSSTGDTSTSCYDDPSCDPADTDTSSNTDASSSTGGSATDCISGTSCTSSSGGVDADSTLQVILESPAESDTYSGIGTLRGWAVAEEGISKVDIYIDGNFFQSAPYGGKRGDVGSIFPEISDSDESGFALAYNFSGLSAGTHTIKVEAVTTQGRVLSRTSQFQVTKFPSAFLPTDQSPDLSGASCVINDQTVHILDTLVDGSVYDVSLEWRTADQGFQIQEIR